jgi:hypothetical protein
MSGKKIANQASRKGESSNSVKSRVILFLKENPESGLAKMHRSIGTNFTKEGLNGILRQLEKDGVIKNIAVKPKDPRYIVEDVAKYTAQFEGYSYKDFLSVIGLDSAVEKTELSKLKKYDTKMENDISELIFKFGLISLQTIIQSHARNHQPKLQEVWLRNAMSFENNLNSAKFSNQVKKKFLQNIIHEKSENEDESKINNNDYVLQGVEMEKTLLKMFPKWAKEFVDTESRLEKNYDMMMNVCKKNPEYLLE